MGSKETRADWRWVKCKMADFLDGILSEQQQEKLYSLVRNLECVGNIKTQLSPLLEASVLATRITRKPARKPLKTKSGLHLISSPG